MNLLITIIMVLLQAVVGHALGFGVAFALGVGNGWELVVMTVGNTIGVWSVEAIRAKLHGTFSTKTYERRLLATAIGSALGAGIILVTPAIGYVQILFPLIGALLGFYGLSRIFPKS